MDKKYLWISLVGIAVIIPIIVVLVLFATTKDNSVPEPVKVLNGGTIVPADKYAVKEPVSEDGTTKKDALYNYTSSFGYSLQYNSKYKTDFTGSKADFYICNDDETVSVAIRCMKKSDELFRVETKEEGDALIEKTGLGMGKCVAFNKTAFNGFDVILANYTVADENGNFKGDMLMAMLDGKEYTYSYIYTAMAGSSETEQQQIGALLYTIKE